MKKSKKGFCVTRGNVSYTGTHLLLELWGARNLSSLDAVEKALTDAVKACGATLLEVKLHHFTPSYGISGVAIIMESHLSVHTWPEFQYAAIDIFVCGNVDPYQAVPILKKFFKPKRMQIIELKRGILG